MSNRYDIEVDVKAFGVNDVLNKMDRLEKSANRLTGRKFNIQLGAIKGDVDKVLAKLKNAKLDIKMGRDNALRQVDKELTKIQNRKLDFDNAFANAKKAVADLNAQLTKTQNKLKNTALSKVDKQLERLGNKKIGFDTAYANANKEIARLKGNIKETNKLMGEATSKQKGGYQKAINLWSKQIDDIQKAFQKQWKQPLSSVGKAAYNAQYNAQKAALKATRDGIMTNPAKYIDGYAKAVKSYQKQMSGVAKDFQKQWGYSLSSAGKTAYNTMYRKAKSDLTGEKADIRYRAKMDTAEVDAAMEKVKARFKDVTITPHVNLKDVYTKVRDMQSRLGSSMQSIGNGLMRLTNPIQSILRGTAYGIGYGALGKVTEGFGRSFARYDVMSTYPKMMKALGYSAEDAKGAIHDLDMSVRGLPTSLDDIVNAQKLFTLASGDMTKATKLAIAANNAFIGGGADETQRTFGMRQLQDLLSAGKLRSQEWYSLFKSMPVAIKAVGEELGYTGKKTKQFQADLMSGKVSTDQFLDGLIKVGSEGGVVYKLAQNMKSTWSAVSANISIAFARMGENILKTLDVIFKQATGKNLLQNVMGLKDYIDGISKSVNNWIKANPDKITNFFNAIKNLDVKGFLQGFGEGLVNIVQFFGKLADILPVSASSIAKFMIYGNMLGRFLGGFGGIVKGTSPLGGAIAAMVRFIRTTNVAARIANIGAVAKLKSFFDRFKAVEKTATATSATGGLTPVNRKLATTASQSANLATSMKQIGVNFAKAVAPAAAIAINVGAVWASIKMISDIGKTKINWGNTAANLAGAGVAIGAIQGFMKVISSKGLVAADVASLKTGAIGALSAIINTGVFTIIAKLLGEINKVNLGKGFFDIHAKLAQIGTAIFEMSAFITGLGAIHVGTVGVSVALNALGALSSVLSAGSFLAVTKALDAIAKLKIPSNDKIKEVADGMKKMTDMLLKKDIWDGFINSLKASDLSSTMNDLSNALEKVNSSMTSIQNISRQLTNFGKKGINEAAIETAVSNMKIVKRGMSKVFEAVNDFFDNNQMKVAGQRQGGAQGADTPDFQIGKFDKYLEMLTSVASVLDQFKLISTKMASIKNAINTIKKTYAQNEGFGRERTIDTTRISKDIGQLVGVIKAITNDESGLAALKTEAQKIQDLDLTNVSTQIKKIPQIMTEINNLRLQLQGQNWMNPISTVETQTSIFKPLKGTAGAGATGIVKGKGNVYGKDATSLLDTIRNMVTMLTDISTELDKVPDMSDKATKLQKALEQLKGAVDYIKQINKSVGGEVIDTSVVKQSIINVIRDMNNALSGVTLLQANALAFKKALSSIKKALASVTDGKGGSATAFANALGKIPGKINAVTAAVKGKGAMWKRELAGGFKGAAKQIRAEVDKIKLALSGLTFFSQGYNAGSTFAQGFNSALSSISAPDLPLPDIFPHTGGLITENNVQYRAIGGQIFKKRGTDTVPAMLTPGEYVMNKKATKTLGVGFLQRLNHLDIKGALNSLYMRGGQLAYATPTVNIDKSTHVVNNNNQQVHLTNNHASQSYQESRASRFMRKL